MSPDHPVLVTGASGHLGANLVRRLLERGARVRVLLHPDHDNRGVDGLEVERALADLRDAAATRRALDGCELVYHCAAKVSTLGGGQSLRREIFETNVLGTRNLLEAARQTGARRVVVTGSFSAVGYELSDPSAPSDESRPFYPFHRALPYEHSKVLAELECLRAVARGQDVVVATSCAILGPNDFLPSRLGRTLCDFSNRRLRAYLPGGFEFVCARDVVEGHLLAMERGASGERYILASGYLTTDELLGLFERVSGVPRPRLRLPAPLMAGVAQLTSPLLARLRPEAPPRFTPGAVRLLRMRRHADVRKAREELGFEPTPLADAVRAAYAFFWERGVIRNPEARSPSAAHSAEPLVA